MCHQEAKRGRKKVLLFLAGVFSVLQFEGGAATLSLAGVAEGAQITLPASRSATNLTVTAQTSGIGGAPEIILSLERQGTILQQFTSITPSTITFSNLSSGKYFLSASVRTDSSVSADVSFDIHAATLQPANDLWSAAAGFAGIGASVMATNTYATEELSEPNHADNAAGHSVWWKWQAISNGVVSMTTAGSSFDTVLAVYTGTNVGALTQVAANDDAGFTNRSSQVSFNAVAGATYYIAVDGAVAADGFVSSGIVLLQILAAAPPSVALAFPTNGLALFVLSPLAMTNADASAAIADPNGVARVEYALDSAGTSRMGILSTPYQWRLSDLPAGDYLLSVNAVNTAGLASSTHASFSVISSSPEIRFVDAAPLTPSGFQFAVTGLKGRSYELQASTNVPRWSRLTLWTNFDGALRVTDADAPQFRDRFYRVVAP